MSGQGDIVGIDCVSYEYDIRDCGYVDGVDICDIAQALLRRQNSRLKDAG